MRGTFQTVAVGALELKQIIHTLRNLHLTAETLLVEDNMFRDPAALLLEMTSPEVARHVAPFIEEAALSHPMSSFFEAWLAIRIVMSICRSCSWPMLAAAV